jgi:hypothetical protein
LTAVATLLLNGALMAAAMDNLIIQIV